VQLQQYQITLSRTERLSSSTNKLTAHSVRYADMTRHTFRHKKRENTYAQEVK